jgi:hypothetical protein
MMQGGRTLYALVELDDGTDRLVRVGLAALRADAQSVFRHGAEDMVAAGCSGSPPATSAVAGAGAVADAIWPALTS